jgi:1-acyl-sn-glycerol-3-phosphate acyltransferase
LSHQDQKKAFHEPPIQSRHWGYSLALQLVRSAVTRFHRIEGIDGIENITEPKTPTIVVANHQNGLMDPLVVVSLISNSQVHWLTRADIFYKKLTRNILFAFNQMPIFRQRDRLSDARERNNRIFEICAERIRIGGRMGLFPEGNHRSMKSLRPLRRGVSDMVNASIALDSSMRNLKILPVGIDYE